MDVTILQFYYFCSDQKWSKNGFDYFTILLFFCKIFISPAPVASMPQPVCLMIGVTGVWWLLTGLCARLPGLWGTFYNYNSVNGAQGPRWWEKIMRRLSICRPGPLILGHDQHKIMRALLCVKKSSGKHIYWALQPRTLWGMHMRVCFNWKSLVGTRGGICVALTTSDMVQWLGHKDPAQWN